MTQFYSYLWLREDGTPFYAGKGSGKRAYIRRENHWPPQDRSRILISPAATEAEALASEIVMIDLFGRKDSGTGVLQNRTDGGEHPPRAQKGRKFSVIGLQNIQETNRKRLLGKRGVATPHFGHVHSNETRQKMSKPRSYRWALSDETKQSMSKAAIDREAKKKEQGIPCGQVFGYQHTDAAKKKMSAAKKGKPSWNKGVPQTAEHLAKLSAVRKGKKWSDARRKQHEEKKHVQF
jgi:NUMOD3 motif-containing protein